jgi:glycerol-3-phosphate dehydrogenase
MSGGIPTDARAAAGSSGGARARSAHAAAAGAFDRDHGLARLAREEFDVLVIGGGITGAGVALDAASRGLRTALVEKGDFASGTSSKSSKLVHGGLRYLQQREIRLVYENLAERQRLLDNAPHLVSPLPFLIPLFGRHGAVSKTVARSYSSILWLYDVTGGLRIGARHRRVQRAEALEHLPVLNTERLVAGFLYYDARADDARLTLAVLRTAVIDHGAVAVNYAPARDLITDPDGRIRGARVEDDEPGAAPSPPGGPGGESGGPSGSVEVRARVVVNAAGVWTDEVRALDAGAGSSIRPAKGVHVMVPWDRMPADIGAVIPVPGDRRSIFVVPWPEGGRTYIGTTDTGYEGALDDPRCTPGDVRYLLDAVNAVTTAGLGPADVTGVWAGLRPLLDPGEGRHVSERTADLSRRHSVQTSDRGLITVTGGKLTTYRKMAQDTVDKAIRHLGGPRRRCLTKKLRLRGAAAPPDRGGPPPGVEGALRTHLQSRYGSETVDVLSLAESHPELLEPVVPGLPYIGAEVVYAARAEMARTVPDVLARRTRAQLLDGPASAAAADRVAALLAAELGWDEARVRAEAARFAATARSELTTAGVPSDDPGERGDGPGGERGDDPGGDPIQGPAADRRAQAGEHR